jgi:hypothetical protein
LKAQRELFSVFSAVGFPYFGIPFVGSRLVEMLVVRSWKEVMSSGSQAIGKPERLIAGHRRATSVRGKLRKGMSGNLSCGCRVLV